jgi:signal transduction histidine kinase
LNAGITLRENDSQGREELLRLKAALRRSEKLALVGQYTASVMHEINNPAEAIGNLIYLISQNANDSEIVLSLSLQVEEQLRRIQYVSRQTLSYFKERRLRQSTDLVALVETAIRFHRPLLMSKQIDLRIRMPNQLFVDIFPGDLLQLVANLTRNAIEAISTGGMLCIRLRGSRECCRLTIADNGCGIPQQLRLSLFEPFHASKAEGGNGLGLWICKEVADRHGGRLAWRTSTEPESHGTTFSLSLAS